MTGFIGGFIAAILLGAATACIVWAFDELREERSKRHDLEVRIAVLEANRKKQNIDVN